MPPDTLDRAAADVLARFPAAHHGDLIQLGNRGGFSGACLWRVNDRCLRAWPPDDSFPARLDYLHHLMTQARAAGLAFVPRVERTLDLATRVEHRGRWWDLTEWLPGRADYHEHPTRERLEAACAALASVHETWGRNRVPIGPCPAVERRFDALRTWSGLRNDGWDPLLLASRDDVHRPLIERAMSVSTRWIESVPGWLTPWTEPRWSTQPCLCDVWHDHLLFSGDRLTGLVDYGSVKRDHVAVDLARMLGSLIEDDEEAWITGFAAYRVVRPLSTEEAELARALDRSGTVLGVANWLRWLYAERRSFENRDAAARRLEALVTRVEKWEQRVV